MSGDSFGAALLSLHDLKGDGLDDLVVGAPGEDSARADAGAVYVYSGSSTDYLDTSPAATL